MSGADAFCLMRDAAGGDIAAQRELAERALYFAANPQPDIDLRTVLVEGAVFARMAASHGDLTDHERCLAIATEMFLLDGAAVCADTLAEMLARLELMADAGNEDAAQFLATRLQDAPPEVVRLAQDFRTRLLKLEETD